MQVAIQLPAEASCASHIEQWDLGESQRRPEGSGILGYHKPCIIDRHPATYHQPLLRFVDDLHENFRESEMTAGS